MTSDLIDCSFEATVGERCVEKVLFNETGSVAVVVSSKLGGNIWDGEIRLFQVVDEGEDKTELVYGCARQVSSSLSDCVWVTDNKTLATSCDDGNLYVFSVDQVDGAKGTQELVLQGTYADHSQPLTAVAMKSVKKQMFSASLDGQIKLWDVTKADKPMQTFVAKLAPMAKKGVFDITCSQGDDLMLSAHQDGSLRQWDTRTPQGQVGKVSQKEHGSCLSLSDTIVNHQVACGYESGVVSLVDTRKDGELSIVNTLRAHVNAAQSVQLRSVDSKIQVVSGGQDGRVVVQGFADGDANKSLHMPLTVNESSKNKFHSDYVKSIAIRPGRLDQVLSGGWDGLIKIISTK